MCQVVVTVAAYNKTLADDPQGEPNATVSIDPPVGTGLLSNLHKPLHRIRTRHNTHSHKQKLSRMLHTHILRDLFMFRCTPSFLWCVPMSPCLPITVIV